MMKRFLMCSVATLAFAMTSFAQTSSGTTPDPSAQGSSAGASSSGTQSSDPTNPTNERERGSSGSSATGTTSDQSANPQSDQGATAGTSGHHHDKAGKQTSVKGCIEQDPNNSSAYILKKGKKEIALNSTEDLKPHVGHTVTVKGTWEKAGATDSSSTSSAGASPSSSSASGGPASAKPESDTGSKGHHGMRSLNVTDVQMVSETCTAGSNKSDSKDKTGADQTKQQ